MTQLQIEHCQAASTRELAAWRNLISTAFSGLEQLIRLNLDVTRSVLFESLRKELPGVKADSGLRALEWQHWPVAPLLEKSVSYGRSVCAVTAETGAELGEVLDSTVAGGHKVLLEAVDAMAGQAKTGAPPVFSKVQPVLADQGS